LKHFQRKRRRKMRSFVLYAVLVLVVAGVIGSFIYYSGGDQHKLEFTFANGSTVYTWSIEKEGRRTEEYRLHPKPDEYNTPPFWSRDKLPKGVSLKPSFSDEQEGSRFWNYYFDVGSSGTTQYIVTDKPDGSVCFAGQCEFLEIMGYRFASSELVYPESQVLRHNRHRFYSVKEPVFWARLKDVPPPNNITVRRLTEKRGPYAEVSSFNMIEGRPVYVARTVERRSDTGTKKEALNRYELVYDFQSILIDCAVLNPSLANSPPSEEEGDKKEEESATPPSPTPTVPQNFVAVVAPFTAKLCDQDVAIGLDRLIEKSVTNGREMIVETLYYSLNGVRHEIPAEVTHPLKVMTPPNRNTSL